jgi:hypothetical protein
MASSSDTRSTRIWLEDTHVALRRPRSAQASNERITFVSALDPRNKRGYDVLLFRPPASTGQKARAVTLYDDHWHELDHDTRLRKPYLGVARPDIHEFDGESLPSDHMTTIKDSDEEPILPRPKSPESSGSEAPTRTLVTYENISQPPTPPNKDSSTHPQYRRSPSPDQYRVSFATILQEQPPSLTDMATMSTTTTAATTTVRPGTPPADPAMASTSTNARSQRITCNLHNAMRRNPPTPGGSGGPGGPGGPEGPGGPGGPGGPRGPGAPQGPPTAVPAAAPAGNADDRVMGNLP